MAHTQFYPTGQGRAKKPTARDWRKPRNGGKKVGIGQECTLARGRSITFGRGSLRTLGELHAQPKQALIHDTMDESNSLRPQPEDRVMPIHDWTRVRANRFHDFHQSWTIAIRNALNDGRLPAGFFAMVEQKTGGPEADVVTLELRPPTRGEPGGVAVAVQPPKARFVARTDAANYARKANRVTVRHADGDVVAVLEIVSPGNKDSRHAIRAFSEKAAELLRAEVHLLIVDLFPPTPRDPDGIHKAIWDHFQDEPFTLPTDKPLTVTAYAAGAEIVAYVEPVAVGEVLPDTPIFLTPDRYVLCPLEATYQTAWEQFPAPLRGPLEAP